MLKQYLILNMCLSELRQLNQPTAERLKLEILIIQIKRLLLEEEIEARVDGDAANEKFFLDLHDKFKSAIAEDFSTVCLADLVVCTDSIKQALKNDCLIKQANNY
jgi:hypothetical protein